ncbi:MAG: MarR family transcriptional regulator [Oscillospiraceae bacterium]|jgi:MarR family transcriptional regulator for hemolysin|nr:MarR family transcriptional regulator [Oscillospiraceae bacterium]
MNSYMKYIGIISRCAAQYRGGRLEKYGVSGYQCTYIINICKNPGISQDRLAKTIFINKSNVTRQLSLLEQNGYVIRQTSKTDKRITEVYPTQKAIDILPVVFSVLGEWNDYITEDFTTEEKHYLLTLLERVAGKSKAYAEKFKEKNQE